MPLHSDPQTQVQTGREEASPLSDLVMLRFEDLLHRAKAVGQQIEGRVRMVTQDAVPPTSQGPTR
jgi:hypothetical protein